MLPTRLAGLLAGACLLLLAACSGPAPAATPAPAEIATVPGTDHGGGHGAAGHGTGGAGLYAVQSGPLGVVTTDAEGHLLYLHTADTPTSSACTGACAQEWLPLLVPDGATPELLGVDPALVGELPRAEGVQLTLAGHPLYHRVDDAGGLTDAGRHGADGAWFAITPTGDPVPTP